MYRDIPIEEVIAALPSDERKDIAKRRAELTARAQRRMTLAELRKKRRISGNVAEALGIGQMQIRGSRSVKIRACPRWPGLWLQWAVICG